MLTTLLVQLIIMSAVLGIISHKTHGTSSDNNPNTPVGLLDALLQRMYMNNSKPYESMTEILGPQYNELFKKPLLQLLEGRKEQGIGQKASEDEKDPLLIAFTMNNLDSSNKKKSDSKPPSATDNESELILDDEREFKQTGIEETPKENERESSGESLSLSRNDIKRKTFKETIEEGSKKNSREKLEENWQENLKEELRDLKTENFKDTMRQPLKSFKENPDQPDNIEKTEDNLIEMKDKGKEHKNPAKNDSSPEKLEELADLEHALQILALLMEQPGYISNAKSATNYTPEALTAETISNATEEASQTSVDMVKSTLLSNLTGGNHLGANSPDDLTWFKPQFKNLSLLEKKSDILLGDNSSDSAITNQNIELFQNYNLYSKIPYSLLSLLANWNQAVSAQNFAVRSDKNKAKHSWVYHPPSNSSFLHKNSFINPHSKVEPTPDQAHLTNESTLLLHVNNTKEEKTFHATTPSVIDKTTAMPLQAVQVSSAPDLKNHSSDHAALRTCWAELNKTKAEVKLSESQEPEAITCIIPRRNTSIFCELPEPEIKGAKVGFINIFNKKNKKDKKKKLGFTTPTIHLITPAAYSCALTAQSSPSSPSSGSIKPCPAFKTGLHPEQTAPGHLHLPTIPATYTGHKLGNKTDELTKDTELSDEGINKLLEDISLKMCLPNMINKLLELVCQNGTNSSSIPAHSLSTMANYRRDHNHRGSRYNRTSSATRLGGNESKKRWVKQSHAVSRDENFRLRKHSPMNCLDKNSHHSNHRRSKSGGNGNRDLSDLLFLVGGSEGQNIKERVESNVPWEQENEVAYMRPYR